NPSVVILAPPAGRQHSVDPALTAVPGEPAWQVSFLQASWADSWTAGQVEEPPFFAAGNPIRASNAGDGGQAVAPFSGSPMLPPLPAGVPGAGPVAALPVHWEAGQLADAVNATPLANAATETRGVPAVKLFAVDSHASKLGLEPAVFVVTRSG